MIKDYKKKKVRDIIEQSKPVKKVSAWKINLAIFLVFTLAVSFLMVRIILMVNAWSEKHVIRSQSPVVIQKPVWVEDRKPMIVLSPIVEQAAEKVEAGSPVEQEILRLWGERYFLLVRSVFKCESGLKEDSVNWVSKDVGVAQINWPTWEKKVGEKFGYTLKDMFDYKKNLEVAHWISDRNNDGNVDLGAWVVYQKGTFVNCVQ